MLADEPTYVHQCERVNYHESHWESYRSSLAKEANAPLV
jgi:hypothetical protein